MTTAWTAQSMCGPQVLEHHRRKWSSAHGLTRYSPFIKKKKKLAPFRHDFLLILIVRFRRFLWRYFDDKCPERIIVMRERSSVSAHRILFTLTQNRCALSLSLSLDQTLGIRVCAQTLYSLLDLMLPEAQPGVWASTGRNINRRTRQRM